MHKALTQKQRQMQALPTTDYLPLSHTMPPSTTHSGNYLLPAYLPTNLKPTWSHDYLLQATIHYYPLLPLATIPSPPHTSPAVCLSCPLLPRAERRGERR